ncbi:integrase [Stenotrophomonas acidaminiphila]|uniref:integrase n=1 Tax=Stenotrophomonas acidaminiphila TaxID=128780 RepID=UPI0020C67735|nr:integrase [Stenotrophomonas acidaminiphila]
MTRGRKRKFSPEIPGHIDQGALPKGIYWGNGRWYWLEPHPEGGASTKRTIAGKSARLSDLHAFAEEQASADAAGTLSYLTKQFKHSSEYKELSPRTQQSYDWLAEQACAYVLKDGRTLGQQQVAHLSTPAVQRIVETIAMGRPAAGRLPALPATPSKANRILQYLGRLFAWGMRIGACRTNPARGVRKVRERGAHNMPEHDAFEAVLRFARERATRQAHSAGSCSPYLPSVMVLAYNVRLRGIEIDTLTDANITKQGIYSNRRKGSLDNITTWTPELRQAIRSLQAYRADRLAAHGRPTPLRPEDRFLLCSESGTPLTKSALDSAWQRLIAMAIREQVISEKQRFALHGLKHRGITDSEDPADGGHATEAMRRRYNHRVPIVKPPKKR